MAEPVIVVDRLVKTYGDGTTAVKGVSFQVQRGEIFGFLGPNGAGKTTTMRILGTLHDATQGRATVLGFDTKSQGAQVRKRIGFAMQEVGMDDLATAEEMLVLHGRLYGLSTAQARARATELLKVFDLAQHAKRRVTRFSGGMQRRLDLAVSLIHTPEVLFLDEPSTGLDPKSRSDLWGVLRRLRDQEGLTILMSTHYMDEADALCDRVAIINNGEISAIDTPANLKRGVGADIVRVSVSRPVSPQQKAGLAKVFGERNLELVDGHVDIKVKDGSRSLLPALQVVAQAGLPVVGTRVISPTLEDVFLRYTGTKFAEADKPVPAVPEKGSKPSRGAA